MIASEQRRAEAEREMRNRSYDVRLHVDGREQLTESVGHRGEPKRKKLIAVFVVIACAILAPTHPTGA
jgi:hypothetical protein